MQRVNVSKLAFVAPGSWLVGNVTVGAYSSIWFGAVLRGDENSITVGEHSSIQDNATLHADPCYPCVVGNRVTVGHNACVHACTVDDEVIVGIGAAVLTGAHLSSNVVVGANAIVKEGQFVPRDSLVVGVGKIIPRNDEEISNKQNEAILYAASEYDTLVEQYTSGDVYSIYNVVNKHVAKKNYKSASENGPLF